MSQNHEREQELERASASRLRPTSRNGQRIGDRFEIIAKAGVGGMGVVYQARDRAAGGLVALKLIDSARVDVARFLREAEAMARIDHPGIVRYVAHGETPEGEHYLAMEWLDGIDLREHLERRKRLTVAESVTLARRLADALEAAHNAGVIHRDLKPSNIFLIDGELEQMRLIDFGVARVVGGPRLTQSGVRIGTPGYFAPEQARGWTSIDARADIFSLGCVIYECLTGVRAFDGESETAILTKLLFHTPRRVSEVVDGVPEEIASLVERMLDRAPEARPKNGGEVLDVLGRIARNRSTTPNLFRGSIPALTEDERKFVSIIVARNAAPEVDLPGDDEDYDATIEQVPVNPLHEIVAPYDGRIELLVDGSAAVMLTGTSSVTELTLRSCCLARELFEAMGHPPMALATGLAELGERLPVGAVIDRAGALLLDCDGSSILLDPMSATLAARRFVVESSGGKARLVGDQADDAETHTVLGRPTPFVGRDNELSRLVVAFRDCRERSQATLVQIVAAGGLGKTRLLEEFLDRVDTPHLLLRAYGDPLRADSPLGALAPALRATLQIPPAAGTDAQRNVLATNVLRLAPAGDHRWVPQMLGEMIGLSYADHGDESPVLREARGDSLLMGDMTRAALEVWFKNEMRQRTVLIIVDDLQWVDHASMLYLDFLLRRLKGSPLFVCTLARPEVTDRFEGLFSGIRAESVTLGPLDQPSCAILAREIIGEPARPSRVEHVIAHCHGNPQLLEELVRADLGHGSGNRGLVGLIETRLSRLNPPLRRVLRAASVFGHRFWLGGVAKLLGGEATRAQARRALHVLDSAELVVHETPSDVPHEEQYRFRSEAIRDAAYSLLTDKDRKLGHQLAGRWLWRAGTDDALILAEHFERGGEPTRAIGFYHRAALDSLESNDFRNAGYWAERAIHCGAEEATLGQLQLLRAASFRWRGEALHALDAAGKAARTLPRGSGDWFKACGELIVAAGRHLDIETVEEYTTELLLTEPRDAQVLRHWILSLCDAANEQLRAGRTARSDQLIHQMQTIVGDRGWRNLRVYAFLLRVIALQSLGNGNPGRALALMSASEQFFQRVGDMRLSLGHQVTNGRIHFYLGDYQHALPHFRQVIANAEPLGLQLIATNARYYMARTLARMSRHDEATRLAAHVMNAVIGNRDRRLEVSCHCLSAEIDLAQGRFDEAERKAQRAFALASGYPPLCLRALSGWARSLLEQQRLAEARTRAEEAMTLVGDLQLGADGIAARLVFAEALYRTGDAEGAFAALRTARNQLSSAESNVDQVALRKSFTEGVWENQRTTRLAREWGLPSY